MPPPRIPAEVIRALIDVLWRSRRSYYARTRELASLLMIGERTLRHWETTGAPPSAGWAVVGVCYRVGGAKLAQQALEALAQAPLPGAKVWGARGAQRELGE